MNTRRVVWEPTTLTMPADSSLPRAGLGEQLAGLMLRMVLSKVMSLPVPDTGAPSSEVVMVAWTSTCAPASATVSSMSIRTLIGVGDGVGVSVIVGVAVGVKVSVTVGVAVLVKVGVGVSVGVNVGVWVGVNVGVN